MKIITCDTYYQIRRPRNTLRFAKTLNITMLLEELGPHLHIKVGQLLAIESSILEIDAYVFSGSQALF